MAMNSEPELIKGPDVAQLAGISARHWARLTTSGRAPACVRLGRSTRWRRDEILGWISAGCPARQKWEDMTKKGGGR